MIYIIALLVTLILILLLIRRSENFHSTSTSRMVVTLYKNDGCGFCQRFQPEWDRFVDNVTNQASIVPNIEAIAIRCELDSTKCPNITGVPTIKIVKDGKEYIYNGDRTAVALLDFCRSL